MFYDILLSLCERHGTNITAFSREIGIAKGSPSNWRKGVSPNSDVVVKAAQYFNVSTDYLLGLDDAPSRSNDPGYTSEESDMIKAIRAAEPAVQRAAISALYSVLDAFSSGKHMGKLSSSPSKNEMQNKGAI